jgi:hypothetical protein
VVGEGLARDGETELEDPQSFALVEGVALQRRRGVSPAHPELLLQRLGQILIEILEGGYEVRWHARSMLPFCEWRKPPLKGVRPRAGRERKVAVLRTLPTVVHVMNTWSSI